MSVYEMSPSELTEYLADVEADEMAYDEEEEACPPTLPSGE